MVRVTYSKGKFRALFLFLPFLLALRVNPDSCWLQHRVGYAEKKPAKRQAAVASLDQTGTLPVRLRHR
jgi:hypothetical protein